MKHGTLSQGKKSTADPKTSLVRNDRSVKRTDNLSQTGLEFHKPFTHQKPDNDNKYINRPPHY